MRDPEDEAFEELALKQGQWQHTSGWRKKQIADAQEVSELYISGWNSALEMAAFKIEKELSKAFPADTLASFSTYIRGMKR